MTTPKRIQRERTKGWRMPEGAVYVGRPTMWGNPWAVGDPHPIFGWPMQAREVVALYRALVEPHALLLRTMDDSLRGHDLACWCPLDQPCHADVLLELVNGDTRPTRTPILDGPAFGDYWAVTPGGDSR